MPSGKDKILASGAGRFRMLPRWIEKCPDVNLTEPIKVQLLTKPKKNILHDQTAARKKAHDSIPPREIDQAQMRDQIEAVQKYFPRSEYRRMQRYLSPKGVRVGQRRLQGVMGKYGLWAERRTGSLLRPSGKQPVTSVSSFDNGGPKPQLDTLAQAHDFIPLFIKTKQGVFEKAAPHLKKGSLPEISESSSEY